MFAPEPEEKIPLEHCMRVYPHQQDTGGFFIAILEKLSEIKAKPEDQSKSHNKAWKFEQEPEVKATDFASILNDVETEPTDANGHLHNDEATNGNASTDEPNSGVKRKADEELELETGDSSKKTKLESASEDPAEEDETMSMDGGVTLDDTADGAASTPAEDNTPGATLQAPAHQTERRRGSRRRVVQVSRPGPPGSGISL